MATIGITASIHRACSSQHITKKQSTQARTSRSLAANVVTSNVEGLKLAEIRDKSPFLASETSKVHEDEIKEFENSVESSYPRFRDERWKNGTWDLNMFVKQGKMDWDSVIVAEAKRRKFLELYPEVSTNEEPVLFRSSIIPWWAWIVHSHLPEAERLNGETLRLCRAAMVGFFMAYIVDALTGLDVVGQNGNFVCKAALLFTIIGVLLFRRKEDVENIQKLVDEATFYDKQWQASWQNPDASNLQNEQSSKKL
ncbi:hypothetical protein BUALT_Bualt06G0080400 [Buddleja alternifolia]|uniref:Uncharacterized protein n=1 Tax=Buddleja alternifolia TaxID=168488 RepID=A0AAV6XLG8_9LAMI|nr:hypothetical protein BUALT_Bualt06G0080400 [Buddleja alternifolia]